MNAQQNPPIPAERHQLRLIVGRIIEQVEQASPAYRDFLITMYATLAELRETDERTA